MTTFLKSKVLQLNSIFSQILGRISLGHRITLFSLGGINLVLNNILESNISTHFSIFKIGFIVIFGGITFGLLFFNLFSVFLGFTGKLMRGKAISKNIKGVVSLTVVPTVISLILLSGPKIIIQEFSTNFSENFLNVAWYSIISLELVLTFFTIAIFVKGISLIQGFSIGKALLNILLASLLFLIPIYILVFAKLLG